MLLILGFFAAPEAGQDLLRTARHGSTGTEARFSECKFRIKGLAKPKTEVANGKTQRYEQSQEVVENKGNLFSTGLKAKRYLKTKGLFL